MAFLDVAIKLFALFGFLIFVKKLIAGLKWFWSYWKSEIGLVKQEIKNAKERERK